MRDTRSGQAMITVMFVAVIGILVTTGSAYALVNNIMASSYDELGLRVHAAAESGVENGLLRLIRNPEYTGETWYPDANTTITTTVTGSSAYTIVSTATIGTFSKRIEAVVHYNGGGALYIDSWRDLP